MKDSVYLKKHRIKFWPLSDGVYKVFQYPADPRASVMQRVELGRVFRDVYRCRWIFVPADRSVSVNGVGDTRSAAIQDICKFER